MSEAKSPFRVEGNVAIIVMDSVPWVSFQKAKAPFMRKHADVLRWGNTCANWTVPSFMAMRKGILPGQNSRIQCRRYFAKPRTDRGFDVPCQAQDAGYFTAGVISLEGAMQPEGWTSFKYERHAPAIVKHVRSLKLGKKAPFYLMVQFQETHMPYNCPGKPATKYESGLDFNLYNAGNDSLTITQPYLNYLRGEQVKCIDYIDGVVEKLYAKLPPCHLIVTADHGDLFGEIHRYGHTYWHHENLFKVPFVYIPPRPAARGRGPKP